MEKAFNKSEAIQKTVEVYKNNDIFSMRAVVYFYDCSDKSIANYFNSKIKFVPDYFIFY